MGQRLKALLIDLSGTIHIEENIIPGSIEALKKIRQHGLKVKFVTNTTKECKQSLHEKLTRIGFGIDATEIFTSLTAARHFIESNSLHPFFLLSQNALKDFEGISTKDPNAVVIGLSPQDFHYEKLTSAFRLLLNGAKLVAIHKARYYKREDGLALGPGAFVSGLEYSAGVEAQIVGKPEPKFFHSALEDLGCSPTEAIMIGDDARDDIKGAIDAGLKGILVQTGKYRTGDETMFSPPPTKTCSSFTEAVDYIIKEYNLTETQQ